jgi:acetyl esterase
MRASPTSILALAVALSIGIAALTGCAPAGIASEEVMPEIVAVNPELATLPDIPVVEDLVYGGTAELPLQLDACLPKHDDAAPVQNAGGGGGEEPTAAGPEIQEPDTPLRAAIVVVHGGSWARGDKADIARRAVCQWFASAGYAAFSVDYRLAPTAVFPAAIDDVQAAVSWLRAEEQVTRFHIDPDRIGAFGGSAGGNLVALLGTLGSGDLTAGSRVAAVAELSGPTDLTGRAVTDDFVPVQRAYLGCAAQDDCPAAIAASPLYTIDPSDPPFFVAHSTAEKIPLGQAELFVSALRAAGVATEFVTVEGTLHSIAMLDADLKARIIEFFDGTIGLPAEPLVQPIG